MFRLSQSELAELKALDGSSGAWGGRRTPPRAFTEQGVAMLSSVLRTPQAVQVNVEIMRAFVRLRRLLGSHAELARKIEELEKRYDSNFRAVFDAIRALMTPPDRGPERKIGFRHESVSGQPAETRGDLGRSGPLAGASPVPEHEARLFSSPSSTNAVPGSS
jgi:hypothetical protein